MTASVPAATPARGVWPAAGTAAPTRSPARLGPLAALAAANALSLAGNVVATVALPWLVLETTGSAALAALSVVSGALAAALGALAAGRVVDAMGPVRTSAAADVLSGLTLAPVPLLAAAGRLEIWHLVVLVFLGTLVDAAGSTARQSLVPVVADDARVGRERANSLFTGTEHAGYLVGAPAGGLLIAALGAAGALWVDVMTFGVSAILVIAVLRTAARRPSARHAAAATASAGNAEAGLGAPSLREAGRFIWNDAPLRALVVIPTLATAFIGPLVPILLPVMAKDLYADPVALGILVGSFGAGGLAGAAGFAAVGTRVARRRLYVGVFVAWPFLYAILAAGAPLVVTAVVLAVLGAMAGSLVPLQATIRQERSPGPLLPRVIGLSTGPVPVVAPLAVLAAGTAIDAFGVAATIAAMTAGIVVLALGVARSEGVRGFDR